MVIDLFGLDADKVRRDYPEVYQYLLENGEAAKASHIRKVSDGRCTGLFPPLVAIR
ncbi:MAG: hypothetical protein WDN06_09405 [Asticcacaulis sp.]